MRKLVVVILAILVTAGFWFGSQMTAAAKLKKAPMIIAKTDIPARTEITEDMIAIVGVPSTGIPPGVITRKEDVIGKYTITNYGIPKNSPIFSSIVKPLSDMPDGATLLLGKEEEMVALQVDLTKYLGGGATSGQHVNLWFMAKNTPDKRPVVGKLFENVQIIGARSSKALEIETSGPSEKEDNKSKKPTIAKVILLAIPKDQVRYFFAAQTIGHIYPTGIDEVYVDEELIIDGQMDNVLDARKWIDKYVVSTNSEEVQQPES